MLKLLKNQDRRERLLPPQQPRDELSILADAAANGEPNATRTLIHAVGPHLLRTIRAVLGRSHMAVEDVAQETVVEFLGALPRFRGEATVVHFACRIAVKCAMRHRRRASALKRTSPTGLHDDADVVSSEEPDPELRTASNRSSMAVLELLFTLPQPQADAFALHAVLGYTTVEIAKSLDISPETVRSRLRLARQALRRRVQEHPILSEATEEG
jgi:RNA polymerase sigma factor (sigma-70 family)